MSFRRWAVTCFAVASIGALGGPATTAVAADECLNASVRQQQGADFLPDCRAYEMVSPLDKGSRDVTRDIINTWATSRAAADGSAVAYSSFGAFAAPQSAGLYNQYRSERGPGGWTTRGASPPLDPGTRNTQNPFTLFWSEDLADSVVRTNSSLLPGTSLLGGSWPLHLQHFDQAGSSFDLLTVPWQPLAPDPSTESMGDEIERFDYAGSSGDMSAVLFASFRQLTEDGPADDFLSTAPGALYLWRDGAVELASVLPDGSPAVEPTPGAWPVFQTFQYNGFHIVSDDGEQVFFQAVVPAGIAVFVHEAGAPTRLVSGSEKVGSDPAEPQQGRFAGAAADGSAAVIAGSELTDDTTGEGNLYRWDGTAPLGSRLEAITPSSSAPRAQPNPMLSEDASVVYFVAEGDPLDAGAVVDQPNLYLWRQGSGVRFVATLSAADSDAWTISRREDPRAMRITPDGDRLAFVSSMQLTENDDDGLRDVYLYDASEDELRCASCSGITPSVEADVELMTLGESNHEQSVPHYLPRNLAANGSRLFFETAEQLVAADTNGLTDVYMWEGDAIHLISSGKGGELSQYVDASETGDDVFFTTRHSLVGSDVDQHVDVYDARVGGGFLEAPQPDCLGDSCQADSPLADRPVAGTARFDGPGNPKRSRKKRCGKGRHAVKKRGKRRCVKNSRHRTTKRERGGNR